MKNIEMLEYLGENMEGLEKIQNFMRHDEPLVYDDLILEIDIDHFEGYEALLCVLLLSTDDPVIERAGKRLLLQLYSDKVREAGGRKTVDLVADLLSAEKLRWEKRHQRLQSLRRQNKI